MSFRWHLCVALAFLNLPKPNCDNCAAEDCLGLALRRRLRELREDAGRSKQNSARGEGTKNNAA